ncbi:MAG: serine/threonine protein kinase [Archangium sp.]|nr:serine/threonine protein kinase [Archangium sp.]
MSSRVGDETIRNVSLVSVSDPLLGQVVEQYKVENVVGTGAMGIVYRGVHQIIGKAVAIKVLKSDFADDPEMVQRLVREARTVNSIRHPAIVDIFGFGTLPRTEQPYIVMDLLEGTPLDEYLKEHAPMRPKEVGAFIDVLLSALAAAHAVGVIHRDLKPGNIFVESKPDGEKGIKVIDFGLAKQADKAGGSVKPTNPGTLLGTPAFMAPEQVLGTKVTPATDLYAVGGIVYQMLTNHLPHEGPTAIDVLSQKMSHDPIRPKQWQPQLDDELDGWIMNLLQREPEKRMSNADEARKSLRRIIDGRTSGVSPVHVSSGSGSSGKNPAISKTTSGVVPKRSWGEAKTVITETDEKSAQLSTDSHKSPWDTTDTERKVEELEPTSAPQRSPFQGTPVVVRSSSGSSARLGAPTVVGEITPVDAAAVSAVKKRAPGESSPTLPPLQVVDTKPDAKNAGPAQTQESEDSMRTTDPASNVLPAQPPSHLPLYIALGTTILALLVGLAYLFLR